MTVTHQSNCPTEDCSNVFDINIEGLGEEKVEMRCENCNRTWEWEFREGELSQVKEGGKTRVYQSIMTLGNLLFESDTIGRNKGPQLIIAWTTAAYITLIIGSMASSYALGILGILLVFTVGSAVTFDMNYMEIKGAWSPYRTFWGLITAIPVVNIFAVVWYLKKRKEKVPE